MTSESRTGFQAGAGAAVSRRARVWWGSAALVAALTIVLYGIVLLNQVYLRPYDYPSHIAWTRELPEGEFHPGGVKINDGVLPHYLFHALVYGLRQITGLEFEQSALAVSLLATVGLALAVHTQLLRALPDPARWRAGLVAGLLTLAVLLAGPLFFLTWHRSNLYLGYITPTVYHNPTVTLLRPFALLLFGYGVRAIEGDERGWAEVAAAALLTVLATYAKPSYTICLLPAMGGVLLFRWLRRRPVNGRLIVGGIVAPGLLVLALQYLFTFEVGSSNRIIFSPLSVVRIWEPDDLFIVLKLALSLVFPGMVAALYPARAARDTALRLAWLVLLVALGYVYLLSEAENLDFGNFTWGAQVALFILFVVSVRFLAQQVLGQERRLTWRNALCGGALALHVVAGSLWYLTEALLKQPRW